MNRETLVQWLAVLARQVYGGIGCVLCQHRIVPPGQYSTLPENRSIELSSTDLRAVLAWVRKRGLDPISLDEVPARLARPKAPKFIVFTFDDGYRDNLTEALPIFREFGVPFAVNPTSGFIARTEPVWWYVIERVLLLGTSAKFQSDGASYEFTWKAEAASRNDMLQTLAKQVRKLPPGRRNDFITAFCATARVDPQMVSDELMLTWDGVRELARDPLVTIGAHGGGHYDLRLFSGNGARDELTESRRVVEAEIGKNVRHLAYPFGGRHAVGEPEFRIAEACGFETAMTTRTGNLFRTHRRHLHALPRLGLSGNYPAVPRLQKLESGLVPAMEHRFRRVITDE